jgi:hypothetical protein
MNPTCRTSGVKQIAPGVRCDVNVGRSEQHVMQSRSIRPIRTTHLGHRMVERRRWTVG